MTSAPQSGADGALITGEELARMADHDLSELIDGCIVSMSPINPVHGRIEANIAAAMRAFVSRYTMADSVPCDDESPGFALSVAAAFE